MEVCVLRKDITLYMKYLYKCTAILIMTAIYLTGCHFSSNDDNLYDDVVKKINEEKEKVESYYSQNTDRFVNYFAETSSPSITLTLLVKQKYSNYRITLVERYAELFMETHPDINIVIEKYETPHDINEQIAIITRLAANPPDIFDMEGIFYEKLNMEMLFVELDELFNSENGLNHNDYFMNIIDAVKVDNKIYHLPLTVSHEGVLINKQYAEELGLDWLNIRTINVDEQFNMYQQITLLRPDDRIHLMRGYSLLSAFNLTSTFYEKAPNLNAVAIGKSVYDIDSKIIDVNTYEMRERLELAKNIPSRVEFKQHEYPHEEWWDIYLNVNSDLFTPSVKYLFYRYLGTGHPYIHFIENNTLMKYSSPIFWSFGDSEVGFTTKTSLAIPRQSKNKELAWEFIKFCMEADDNFFQLEWDAVQIEAMPVNRNQFNNQLREILKLSLSFLINVRYISFTGSADEVEAEKELLITYSLEKFIEEMEMLNYEIRYDYSAFMSLIYPDLYLYYLDYQDAERTLLNIQNRLHLYVNE